MLLNTHISADARCVAGKVCGLVRSTWGTSLGEDKLGARDKILNTKVARRACAGQTFPQCYPLVVRSMSRQFALGFVSFFWCIHPPQALGRALNSFAAHSTFATHPSRSPWQPTVTSIPPSFCLPAVLVADHCTAPCEPLQMSLGDAMRPSSAEV